VRVLVVEDNRSLARIIQERFERMAINCHFVHTSREAESATRLVSYDLIILDQVTKSGDGPSALQDVQRHAHRTPVLVLSAADEFEGGREGLRDGLDDLLVKPFTFEQLLAKVEVLPQHSGTARRALLAGNIKLDVTTHQVMIAGRIQTMPMREAIVLELLMRAKNEVVPREAFAAELFGIRGEQGGKAIDVYVHRLRKTLQVGGAAATIRTLRGVGFMLSETT